MGVMGAVQRQCSISRNGLSHVRIIVGRKAQLQHAREEGVLADTNGAIEM